LTETGATARQSVTIETGGEEQNFALMLRQEPEGWRIHGMVMPFEGDAEWTIDFEQGFDELDAIGEGIAQALGEGLEQAFTEGMDEWMAESAAQQAAEQNERFAALAEDGESSLQPGWSGALQGAGRTAGAALEEILADTGLGLEAGDFAERLEQPVQIELANSSRIEAFERLARELDLTPIYTDELAWNEEASNSIRFEDGARSEPIAFTGPFAVWIRELVERPPFTTGEVVLEARALGLPAASLAGNGHMFEVLKLNAASSPQGIELLADPEMSIYTEPERQASMLGVDLTFELGGLLSTVDRIASLEGRLSLARTSAVHRAEFEGGSASIEIAGHAASVTWNEDKCSITIEGAPELEGFESQFAAWDAEGNAIALNGTSGYGWNGKFDLEARYDVRPARLGLCLFATEYQAFPFAFSDVPLTAHAQQPAQRTELTFEGPSPIDVRFVGFVLDTDPDFTEVELHLRSRCNKQVLEAQVSFLYLDASGNELGSFPHTLTGEFDFEGTQPLLEVDQEAEQTTVAFFLAEGTRDLRTRIESVEFADGTSWTANE
jgi:hypothetical protein